MPCPGLRQRCRAPGVGVHAHARGRACGVHGGAGEACVLRPHLQLLARARVHGHLQERQGRDADAAKAEGRGAHRPIMRAWDHAWRVQLPGHAGHACTRLHARCGAGTSGAARAPPHAPAAHTRARSPSSRCCCHPLLEEVRILGPRALLLLHLLQGLVVREHGVHLGAGADVVLQLPPLLRLRGAGAGGRQGVRHCAGVQCATRVRSCAPSDHARAALPPPNAMESSVQQASEASVPPQPGPGHAAPPPHAASPAPAAAPSVPSIAWGQVLHAPRPMTTFDWAPTPALSRDENFLDLALVLARNSKREGGHMGCTLVRGRPAAAAPPAAAPTGHFSRAQPRSRAHMAGTRAAARHPAATSTHAHARTRRWAPRATCSLCPSTPACTTRSATSRTCTRRPTPSAPPRASA